MTKDTYTNIALTLQFIATVTAIIIVLSPLPLHLPTNATVEMTTPEFSNPTVEMTIPQFLNPIFEHKDTAIQMTFFDSHNDYYYLKSITDDNWIWTGTHQQFITQFRPIEEPQETNQ